MKISYFGIKTNNVKDIDIEINAGQIIYFGGPSGSGKSSIAVDTIHKISEDELFQLFSKHDSASNYDIRDYENILPSVCLQQENYNRNPRSTIATYFGLDIYFKQIFSLKNAVSQSLFQFNTLNSACETCRGTGVLFAPDPLMVVDYSCAIGDLPFRPWRISRREYYEKSLELFASEKRISLNSKFNELSLGNQQALLYGESASKYKIEFKANGRKHVKTAKYLGPLKEIAKELDEGSLAKHRSKYLGEITCHACGGARFSSETLRYRAYGKSIGELYLLEIDALQAWIQENGSAWRKSADETRSFRKIERFLESLIRLNLNYLNLNRSIPTLSGGELQRLRLSKAANSHFTSFIYVLDEPTSGLHPCEWQTIADVVLELKRKKNTILIIEHNEFLKAAADRVILLGPGGGRNGGHVVPNRKVHSASKLLEFEFFKARATVEIKGASSNNIKDLNCALPLGTLVGVCGVSGSGKTSFLKTILPRYLDGTQYISQTPIRGNSYSIVATALGIFDEVQKMFCAETRLPKEYFIYSSKGKGQCEICLGKGIIEEELTYIQESFRCPACSGRRFSTHALKRHWNNLSIHDFLTLSIDEAILNLPQKYNRLRDSLLLSSKVGLGYLSLFQNTSTLSGGEAQRIKFVARMLESRTKQVYLLDEPFRGVDRENIQNIISVLYSLVEQGSTVIISEHSPFALQYCSYLVEFGPESGMHGGRIIYSGERESIYSSSESKMAAYLKPKL